MALEDILTAIRVVVAGEAGTTAGTAKTHVAHLLAKLGARDRVQLVITAYQAGLFGT